MCFHPFQVEQEFETSTDDEIEPKLMRFKDNLSGLQAKLAAKTNMEKELQSLNDEIEQDK